MTVREATRAELPEIVRQVAAVGLVAFVLGRAVGPALHGAAEGLDSAIVIFDRLGNFASYLFAFAGVAAAIMGLSKTYRDPRFSAFYRFASVTLGIAVVSLIPAALREPLTERANVAAAAASALLALLAAREALAVPRTRALGVLLGAAGVAALLHLGANVLAWHAGERAPYSTGMAARLLATLSVLFDTLSLLTAFAWLTTRGDTRTVWFARIALFVACVLAFGAMHSGRDNAPLWELLAGRSVQLLVPSPPPLVWQPFSTVLETTAPLFALATIAARGQVPAIVGSLALVLLARPSTDVPLCALALTLASITAPLAAHDDRGMWAILMAKPR